LDETGKVKEEGENQGKGLSLTYFCSDISHLLVWGELKREGRKEEEERSGLKKTSEQKGNQSKE